MSALLLPQRLTFILIKAVNIADVDHNIVANREKNSHGKKSTRERVKRQNVWFRKSFTLMSHVYFKVILYHSIGIAHKPSYTWHKSKRKTFFLANRFLRLSLQFANWCFLCEEAGNEQQICSFLFFEKKIWNVIWKQ